MEVYLIQLLQNVCLSTLILYIWFNTDVIVWWSKLFKLDRIFNISGWENYQIFTNSKISYLDYLLISKKTFWYKLVSCKLCLLFWISLIFSNGIKNIGVVYILSYILYLVFVSVIKKISK